ncbi:MAG: hypothetical protein E7496_01005 [Ruminococcus sp.]|nr:hypothetical protein [Ruminococcus sp.]
MKLFIDTNVIIDLLAYRYPQYPYCKQIIDMNHTELYVYSGSLTTIAYLLKGKSLFRNQDKSEGSPPERDCLEKSEFI